MLTPISPVFLVFVLSFTSCSLCSPRSSPVLISSVSSFILKVLWLLVSCLELCFPCNYLDITLVSYCLPHPLVYSYLHPPCICKYLCSLCSLSDCCVSWWFLSIISQCFLMLLNVRLLLLTLFSFLDFAFFLTFVVVFDFWTDWLDMTPACPLDCEFSLMNTFELTHSPSVWSAFGPKTLLPVVPA